MSRGTGSSATTLHRIASKSRSVHQTFPMYSGYTPRNRLSVLKWKQSLLQRARSKKEARLPSVQAFAELIERDPIVNRLTVEMLRQNEILQNSDQSSNGLGDIDGVDDLLDGINEIIQAPPPFEGQELIGVPLAAFFTGVDATQAGQALFRLPVVNVALKAILKQWHDYLKDPAQDSNSGFCVDGEAWLSEDAVKGWQPNLWAKDNTTIPCFDSWNAFFTRQFADREKERPVAAPEDPSVITSCNDGMLFRWRASEDVQLDNVFWFKDMPYSLNDVFRAPHDPAAQEVFDRFNLADRFLGGSVFQTFLNPFDFHRWWSPVSGKILFDPQVVQGTYYNKLDIPDLEGSTTNSLPFLMKANCRGICVIDTGEENIGYVCCIPIGMVEVSTIKFGDAIAEKADVTKGEELGYFQFGGSSFAIIFEDASKYKKKISFKADHEVQDGSPYFPENPDLPTPMGGVGIAVRAGMQIAVTDE